MLLSTLTAASAQADGPDYLIGGHVSFADSGESVGANQVTVTIYDAGYDSDPDQSVKTDSSGNWVSNGEFVPGEYQVYFKSNVNGYQSVWYGGTYDASTSTSITVVDQQLTDVDASLPTAPSVSGEVDLGTSGSLAGAGDVTVTAQRSLPTYGWSSESSSTTTGADGTYALTNLTTGTTRLLFHYVGSGSYSDTYSPTFQLADGPYSAPAVVLPPAGAITGVVTDSSGVPETGLGVALHLYGDSNPNSIYATSTTDSNGRFTFHDLGTATYRLKIGAHWWNAGVPNSLTGDNIAVAPGDSVEADYTYYATAELTTDIACASCTADDLLGDLVGVEQRLAGASTWSLVSEQWNVGTGEYGVTVLPGEYRIVVTAGSSTGIMPTESAAYTVAENQQLDIGTLNLHRARVLARTSGGTLYSYTLTATGKLGSRVKIGSGLEHYDSFSDVGDFNGDGYPDVIARSSAGNLWLYPGTASGKLGTKTLIASGWSKYSSIRAVGDVDQTNTVDIVARDSKGTLFLFPGDTRGGIGAPRQIGATGAWKSYKLIAGPDLAPGYSPASLMALDSSGRLWYFAPNGDGTFAARTEVESGMSGYRSIVSIGSVPGQAYEDFLGFSSGKSLYLFKGTESGKFTKSSRLASGWTYSSVF
jgi:hypothetical protein